MFGLSLRKLVCFSSAVVLGVGTYFLCTKVLGLTMDTASYIIIAEALPLMAFGFIKKDGMTFEKYAALLIRHKTGMNKLSYENELVIDALPDLADETAERKSKYAWIFEKKPAVPGQGSSSPEKSEKKPGKLEKPLSLRSQKKAARESARKHSARLKQLDKNTEQLNAERKKQLKKAAAPKNTVQQIKYDLMFEDGICQIEHGLYSRSFKFSDINYQTARRDEQVDLFTRYCEALNYCDPTIHLQINIVNRRIDKEAFKETMFMPMIDGQAKLNHYRKEMNGMLAAKALEGQNSILREKYITFSTAATSYETAIPALARLETDLMGHYKALGCEVAAMSGIDRLQQLHEIFRPGERFTFAYDQLLESSLTTKACIAPDSFDFTDKDMFSFGSHTGEHYGQVLFLRDLPAELSDKIISELSDLPIDMNITLHITNVEQGKALELVRRQIAFMEMEATGKQDQAVQKGRNADIAIPMETRRSYDEATKLLDLLENKNQRMFKVTLLVYTFADDIDTLQDNAFQIMATARKTMSKLIGLLSGSAREL